MIAEMNRIMSRSFQFYVLDKHGDPKPVSFMVWAEWFETADRLIAQTIVRERQVSTIFLGNDMRMGAKGPPVLYESMVFKLSPKWKADRRYPQLRYSTGAEAIIGHAYLVGMVKAGAHGLRSWRRR